MFQYNVKARYMDRQCRSHYFKLVSDSSYRNFIKDLVRAKYPSVDIFINNLNQDY